MKAYRWMSKKEFQKLMAGCDINVVRRRRTTRTTGKGIFFFPEDYFKTWMTDFPDFVSKQPSPEFSSKFLSGIVSQDVLVEFDVQCEPEISYGVYANPYTGDWDDYIEVDELCVPFYNRETMVPIRYFIQDSIYNSIKGTWYAC